MELLEAVHRVLADFGGSVPLPLLAVDPEVLKLGRKLAGDGPLPSLQVLVEDAARIHPVRAAGLHLLFGQAYPVVTHPDFVAGAHGKGAAAEEPAGARGGQGDGHRAASGSKPRGKRARPASPRGSRSPVNISWQPRSKNERDDRAVNLEEEEKLVKADGVQLAIVCGNIPVVDLARGCDFDLNASWLLQLAMGSLQKADSLFQDAPWSESKRSINRECKRRGLADLEEHLWVATAVGRKGAVAVGVSGKRSVMLALVVAMALDSSNDYRACLQELRPLQLDASFVRLIAYAKGLVRREGGKP